MRRAATLLISGALALSACQEPAAAGESSVLAPAASRQSDEAKGLKQAIFSGGCYWGVEGVFSHVLGVTSVIPGFQGMTDADAHLIPQVTTLGRGGSDTSAAYFAAKLKASALEIWTDVPGMFSANPRSTPAARQLRTLTYDEAQEIATAGAKVLHPRCILPARQYQIPLYVFATQAPQLGGTLICQKDAFLCAAHGTQIGISFNKRIGAGFFSRSCE